MYCIYIYIYIYIYGCRLCWRRIRYWIKYLHGCKCDCCVMHSLVFNLAISFQTQSCSCISQSKQPSYECVVSARNRCDLNSVWKLMFSPAFIGISRTPCRQKEEVKTCLLLAALSYAMPAADVQYLWSWDCIRLGSVGLLNLRCSLKIGTNLIQNIRFLSRYPKRQTTKTLSLVGGLCYFITLC
jgi:hypothetical protein